MNKLDIIATILKGLIKKPYCTQRGRGGDIFIQLRGRDVFWFDVQGGQLACFLGRAISCDLPPMDDPEWPEIFKEKVLEAIQEKGNGL